MSTIAEKTALTLSTIVFAGIGGFLVFAPGFLFGLNKIALDPSAAMMSEIRAPGMLILLAAGIAVLGLFRDDQRRMALSVSAGLLLAYGAGRLISLPLDGVPPVSLLLALIVELALGGWCAFLAFSNNRFHFQRA